MAEALGFFDQITLLTKGENLHWKTRFSLSFLGEELVHQTYRESALLTPQE